MNKILCTFLIFFSTCSSIVGQELNMKITVNADKIDGADKAIFQNLEQTLNQFVNGRRWTDATFATSEQISCSMLITVEEITDQNTYKGNVQLTSTRPIYNSSYNSPLFNFKDDEFEFVYQRGQNLEYRDGNIDNNLIAVVAYYCYIILGLDFDSYALGAGKQYFDKALEIANSAQMLDTKGWATFGGDHNRYALALALTDEPSTDFHTMWYNYHRKGLDDMAANATRGRTVIEETLTDLQKIRKSRPASAILFFYGDTKLNELINIYSEAKNEDKQEAYKTLVEIYPTKKYLLEKLKNNK